MREETLLWLRQARDDLAFARGNLEMGAYYVCAFLSEQAAEKALEALYIEQKREPPPRTHNLVELGRLLGAPEELLSMLREINPDYTTTRYPDAANGLPSDLFDKSIAGDHHAKGKEIVRWVEDRI